MLCFSTQPVTVTSTPPQCLLTDVQGSEKKKNLLSSDGCSTTFEISVSSRLLSLQGQRSSRRRKGAVGREGEEQNGKKKSWC